MTTCVQTIKARGAPIQRVLRLLGTDAYTLDGLTPGEVARFLIGPGPSYFLLFLSARLFRFGSVRLLRPFISAKYRSSKGTGEAEIQSLTKISTPNRKLTFCG
jgi:hypothetical protein